MNYIDSSNTILILTFYDAKSGQEVLPQDRQYIPVIIKKCVQGRDRYVYFRVWCLGLG